MDAYDETQATIRINSALAAAGRKEYDGDEILNVIDMIWDYYEENGLLDIDDEFEAEEDEDIASELADYVTRMLKKDTASAIKEEDVRLIIDAELQYEDSLLDI